MKNIKRFPKLFIQIFSLLGILIILIHSLIFFIFPKTYLETRKEEISSKADEIAEIMNGKTIEYVQQGLDFYSQSSEIRAFVEGENKKNEIQVGDENSIGANLQSDSNSLIIEEREITLDTGKKVYLQFISATDMREDAKELSLNFLPYSLLISVIASVVISLVYAKIAAGRETLKLEKLKYDFFRGASHELKTPLASLKIILENMKYNIGKYKDRDMYIEKCIDLVDNMTQNVSQILSVSSIENLKNDEEILQVGDILTEVLEKYEVQANQKSIRISNSLTDETLCIGKTALKIVLSNLISNAVKYTDEKGFINIGSDAGWLYVENSYSGKDNQDMSKIFDVNFDLNKENSSGLGLYIVANLLKNYRIKYEAEQKQERFVFKIEL